MKKVLIGLGVAACVFGFGSSAFAVGVGGIAGSAAFQLTGGVVTSSSVAIGVGKSTGYAGATTDTVAGGTEAFAAGTGGVISLTGTDVYLQGIAEDGALGTPQLNIMAVAATVVSIDAVNGTVTVP